MNPIDLARRHVLAAGAGLALTGLPAPGMAQSAAPRQMLSAASYGARGDGVSDDSTPLQTALNDAFAPNGPGFLAIPPGTYRVTRTLRFRSQPGLKGNLTHNHGILAHGARIVSAVVDGSNVLEIESRSTNRFLLIEGLDILGNGREGHGIALECEYKEHYLYNFCLRDVSVQGCGGDGCHIMGNVFEGQIINTYLRDNKRNGLTLGHGERAGILSAIHVFGCVFGQNGQYGVAMVNGCYDVAFHGCYFLLNGKHGLVALNGCTLLSNCGFENNHEAAPSFSRGGPGIWLQGFGTLVACTAYSIFKQTRLIEAYVVGQFVMMGCSGSGDGDARAAGLARLAGDRKGRATLIGPSGAVDYVEDFEGLEISPADGGGIQFGARWSSANLARLGDYRLWIDSKGRLRLKNGTPASDEDGHPAGG